MANISGITRTGLLQAKADLRPQLWGKGFITFILNPLFWIAMAWALRNVDDANGGFSSIFIASILAGLTPFAIMQISGEMYNERLSGSVLRAKTLPFGVPSWMIGKVVSVVGVIYLQALLLIALSVVFIPAFNPSIGQIALGALIVLLALIASSPIGFILGSFAKSVGLSLVAYAIAIALLLISGIMFPMSTLPSWVHPIAQVFPVYWGPHLSRYVFLGGEWEFWEAGGIYQPALGVAVLLLWSVIGFIVAAAVIRRTFRKESISSQVGLRTSVQQQVGI